MLLSELYFYWLLLHCNIVSTAQQQLLSSPSWGLLACHAWTLHLETQSSEMRLGYKPLPAYICRRMVLFWSSSLLLYFDHTLQLHLSSAVDGEVDTEKASQGHFITCVSDQVPLQMQKKLPFQSKRRYGAAGGGNCKAALYRIYLHNQHTCIINASPISLLKIVIIFPLW